MSILKLLANDNFIIVNKALIKSLGLYEAILLGEFASEYLYWENQNKIENDYFYSTIENVKNNTGLSASQQLSTIKKLSEKKIIETQKRGLPAKRYIKIDQEQVLKYINIQSLKNLTTSCLENKELVVKKLNGNNNNIKIINNNKFKKPTIEEIKNYCLERNNTINAEQFFDYYESKGWIVGRSPMKDWKSAVRTWERNRKEKNNVGAYNPNL